MAVTKLASDATLDLAVRLVVADRLGEVFPFQAIEVGLSGLLKVQILSAAFLVMFCPCRCRRESENGRKPTMVRRAWIREVLEILSAAGHGSSFEKQFGAVGKGVFDGIDVEF